VRPQPPFTSSARRAGARVNSKQRVCVRERVYSFLKRDVVRRTEEQSSLLCPQLPPLPAQPHFPVSTSGLVASSPPAVARQSRAKGVCREAAEKLRVRVCPCGLDCASLCVYVCVLRQERINLVSDPVVHYWRNASVLRVWSLRASAGCIGNLLQSGWDPVVPSSFYRLPDVPTRGSPATASGGFG